MGKIGHVTVGSRFRKITTTDWNYDHDWDGDADTLQGYAASDFILAGQGGSGFEVAYRKNIIQFGADPTGVADSRTAIQDAIDEAYSEGGGVVFIPNGEFKVTKAATVGTVPDHAILLKPNVKIEGIGFSAEPGGTVTAGSIIKLADGQNCNVISTINDTYHYGCALYGIGIHGNKTNNASYSQKRSNGVYITASDRFTIDNCFFFQNRGAAVYAEATSGRYAMQPMISRSFIFRNRHGIQMESGATDAIINQCDIGENVDGSDGKGVILGAGSLLLNCAIWGNTIGVMGWGSWHTTISGCRIDYNLSNAIYIFGCKGVNVSGTSIYDNSANGDNTHSAVYIDGNETWRSEAVIFSGCLIGDSLLTNPDNTHKYAIEFGTTEFAEPVTLSGCYTEGNGLGLTNEPDMIITDQADTVGGLDAGSFALNFMNGMVSRKVTLGASTDAKSGLDHHQGYTTDGTNHYVIDTAKITKYDASWVQSDENASALTGLPAGYIHLCDGHYYDGKLYIPVNDWNGAVSKLSIAIYDAVTLELLTYKDITSTIAEGCDGSGCVVVPEHGKNGTIYIVNYLNAAQIHRVDLSTFESLGAITLTSNPGNTATDAYWQGITYHNGMFFVSANNGYIWTVSRDGYCIRVMTTGYAGSHEGVDIFNDKLHMLVDNRTYVQPYSCKIRTFTLTYGDGFRVDQTGVIRTGFDVNTGTSTAVPFQIYNTDAWTMMKLNTGDGFTVRISQDGNGLGICQNAAWNGASWIRDWQNGSSYPSMALLFHEGSKQLQFRYKADDNNNTITWGSYPFIASGEDAQAAFTITGGSTKTAQALVVNQAGTGNIAEFQDNGTAVLQIKDGGVTESAAQFSVSSAASTTVPISVTNTGSWVKEEFVDTATAIGSGAYIKNVISMDTNGLGLHHNAYYTPGQWKRNTWSNGASYPSMSWIFHRTNKRFEFRYSPDNNSENFIYYNAPLFISGESSQPNVYSDKNSNSAPTARFNQAGTGDILDLQDGGTSVVQVKDGGIIVVPKTSGTGIKVDPAAPTWGWKDLIGPIHIRDTNSQLNPSFNVYRGGIRQYQFSVNDETYLEFHMPHDYVPGSDIHIHAHWSHNSQYVTGGGVVWDYEVIYSKGHDQEAFSAPITCTPSIQYASGTQYKHLIQEVQLSAGTPTANQLDSDNLEVDGLIIVRCYLKSNTMTVSQGGVPEPFLHFVDIHYQSTQMATKNKAPNFYA